MTTNCGWPKPLMKYGLTDDTGAELVPPVFDDLLINKYFIFAKHDKKWGDITDYSSWDKAKYVFDDVKVFEYVAWVKLHGKWGMLEACGRKMADYVYDEVRVIDDSSIVVASNTKGFDLFTAEGNRLFKEYEIFELPEFESGYAVVTVFIRENGAKKYFAIRTDGAIIRDFDDVYSCSMCVNDLRNDFVWIKNQILK